MITWGSYRGGALLLDHMSAHQAGGYGSAEHRRREAGRQMVNSRAISHEELRERLAKLVKGRVLGAGDLAYEESRHVFNAMIERRPAAIITCSCAEDVVHGVTAAREYGLPISIKGGGHSVAGNAVCEDGLMLDMSPMKRISVDPERNVTVAEAGLTLGEFDAATSAYGLATTLGVVSMTGIAGLTLGGGIGWLNGKHGLACDNVLSMGVVTADGQVRTVNADEHQDLFWAMRGGGGNFGVVLSFTYRLHPVTMVLAGPISYPPGQAADALHLYHQVASTAPDSLATAASVSRGDDGKPAVSVMVCWSGPAEEGEEVLRPLREFGPPTADAVGLIPYRELQTMPDAGFPSGRLHYWKASFLADPPSEAIDTMLRFAATTPSPSTGIGLQQITGAASRVAPAATAFAHRARQYDFLILSQWDSPADSPANIRWTRELFDAMGPHFRGVYVNNLGEEGSDRVKEAYGSNYDRLADVKAAYDPDNVFRLNQNIRPADGAGA
jgi:FAD/FMN-containing dehydrogenase